MRPRPPNLDDMGNPKRWMEIATRWMRGSEEDLTVLSPDTTPGISGNTTIIINQVQGAAPGLSVPNTINLQPGELVNIANGIASRAGYDALMATHAVGELGPGTAICYQSWASGPLRIDGNGTSSILWLGLNGQARREKSARSASGNSYWGQVVGFALVPLVAAGVITVQLQLDMTPIKR